MFHWFYIELALGGVVTYLQFHSDVEGEEGSDS